MGSVESQLRSLGIESFVPGFYDDPAFVAAEQKTPSLLEEYAAYVREREYTPEYLDQARVVVKAACDFLFARLVKDGRLGACCDASMVLARMLDRQGIWNYLAKGSLSIDFDKWTGCDSYHFGFIADAHTQARRAAPHAWVVAPPFRVVDVTVKRQAYEGKEARHLPDYVLAEDAAEAEMGIEDWFDRDAIPVLEEFHGRPLTLADARAYAGEERYRNPDRFGVYSIRTKRATLKYGTIEISVSDKPLEGITSLCLSGDYPPALYAQLAERLQQPTRS